MIRKYSSFWLRRGVRFHPYHLFVFTEELESRFKELAGRGRLTPEELAELKSISGLLDIITFINQEIMSHVKRGSIHWPFDKSKW